MGTYKHNFLIAVPQLLDPNFNHSIVLMLEHQADGALGIIINDATALTLGTFAKNHKLACHNNLEDMPVFRGGPVEPAVGWIIHTEASAPEKKEILPGLFVSGSQDSLKHLLALGNPQMRLFLGYAGWSEEQLEEEVAHGSWISTDINAEHIFETKTNKIWQRVLSDMGIDPSQLIQGDGHVH